MDETQTQDAAAKRRSDAAKKAAETRRRNAEAEEAQSASQVQPDQQPEQTQAETTGALQPDPDEQPVVQAEDAPEEQSKEQAAPQQTEWEQITGRRADVRVDDQVAHEAQKQAVLDAERRHHNARTAGESV